MEPGQSQASVDADLNTGAMFLDSALPLSELKFGDFRHPLVWDLEIPDAVCTTDPEAQPQARSCG
eukprot:1522284-Rhodomonas_salina.1